MVVVPVERSFKITIRAPSKTQQQRQQNNNNNDNDNKKEKEWTISGGGSGDRYCVDDDDDDDDDDDEEQEEEGGEEEEEEEEREEQRQPKKPRRRRRQEKEPEEREQRQPKKRRRQEEAGEESSGSGGGGFGSGEEEEEEGEGKRRKNNPLSPPPLHPPPPPPPPHHHHHHHQYRYSASSSSSSSTSSSSSSSFTDRNQLWNRPSLTPLTERIKINGKIPLRENDTNNNNILVIHDMNTYKRYQPLPKLETFYPEKRSADRKSLFLFYDIVKHSWSDKVEARVVLNESASSQGIDIDYELSKLFENNCKTVIVLVDTTDMILFGSFLFDFLMTSVEYIFLISNIKQQRYVAYLSRYNESQRDMTWSEFYENKLKCDQKRRDLKQFLRSSFNDVNFSQIAVREGFRYVQTILPSLYEYIEELLSFQSEDICTTVDEAKDSFQNFQQARDGIWQVRCIEDEFVKIVPENLIKPMNYYTQSVLVNDNCISFVYDVSKNRSAKEDRIILQLDEGCITNNDILYHILYSYCRKFLSEGRQKSNKVKPVNFVDQRNLELTIGIAKERNDNDEDETMENQDLYVTIIGLFLRIFEDYIAKTDNEYKIWLHV